MAIGRIGVRFARRIVPNWLWTRLKRVHAYLSEQQRHLRFTFRLASNLTYDFLRYRRYSADSPSLSDENLRALIAMDAHRIEKGLALRAPRVAFGIWFLERLLNNLKGYQAAHGSDHWVAMARQTLRAYVDFNEQRGYRPTVVYEGVAALDVQGGDPLWTQEDSDGTCGGTMSLLASAVRRDACLDLQSFFRSRHSIRQFGEGSVPRQVIESAVSMAMYSPSVCNRQSWRVHVYTEPQAKASVLSLQNGNRGFGDQAAHVLIVASEIESFASVGERNQCWIDGGMFSMSLIYALHSLGLGTCCLNWSVEKEKDSALRTVAGIPDSQAVIMMIAVGPLPEVLSVARSARRPLNHIVVFHEHTKAPSTPTGTR